MIKNTELQIKNVYPSDEDSTHEWLLAIGPMMNVVTLNSYAIYPKSSHPTKLNDYKLIFHGPTARTAAEKVEGRCLHGVIYKITEREMKELDKIE